MLEKKYGLLAARSSEKSQCQLYEYLVQSNNRSSTSRWRRFRGIRLYCICTNASGPSNEEWKGKEVDVLPTKDLHSTSSLRYAVLDSCCPPIYLIFL